MKNLFKALFLVILIQSLAVAADRAVLLRQLRYSIKDTSTTTNNVRWTDDILLERMNIVQEKIAMDTLCLYKEHQSTPTAEQAEYTLPTDMYVIDRVAYLSQSSATAFCEFKKLKAYTLPGLDTNVNILWENSTSGLPMRYYEKGNVIGLNPKPSSVYVSTGALKIDYYARPQEMDSDDDVPWNGFYPLYSFHDLIIQGTAIWCLSDEGYDVSAREQKYYRLLDRMKNAVRYKPDQNSGSIPVNYQ